MLIAWDNKADGAVLTASSELAAQPGSNVQEEHVSRKWKTGPGVTTAFLLLDMLSSVSCALLAVLGTNLTAAATLRLRASDTDPNAVANLLLDTGTLAAGVKAGYGAAYKSFTATAARYSRLDLTDTTLVDSLEVGRLFLGPSWQVAHNQNYGWSVTPIDPSEIEASYGGQEYADELPQRRQLQFVLDWLTEAEAHNNALAMARANGIVRDVLAIPDINGAYLSEQAVWGRLTSLEPILNRRTLTWSQKFTVRERL